MKSYLFLFEIIGNELKEGVKFELLKSYITTSPINDGWLNKVTQ